MVALYLMLLAGRCSALLQRKGDAGKLDWHGGEETTYAYETVTYAQAQRQVECVREDERREPSMKKPVVSIQS